MSILNIYVDPMHLLELGIVHHVLGSVLWLFCYVADYFPNVHTPADRLDAVWHRISRQYAGRGTPVQLSNLDLRWFTQPDAPHRRHPFLTLRVKAAETRHLVPIISDIWRHAKTPGDEHDELVQDVLIGLTRFYECMESKDR